MTETKRDKLRGKLLGSKKDFKTKTIEWEGDFFEFRQPTMKLRSKIYAKSKHDSDSVEVFEFMVWSVIYTLYVPGTNDLVFEESDYEALMENPVGGFMDEFSETASQVMNVDPKEKKK